MQKAVPNYYHKFTCIADRCRHSCCIGWEIDIDEKTMAMYQTMALPIGEDIRNSIEGDEPHFKLQSGDRCPFLKDNGLCRIICECGKDALCDICRLHPRFRNFYSSFVETGLGLCCEEAARIILFDNEPFSILLPDDVELTEDGPGAQHSRDRFVTVPYRHRCRRSGPLRGRFPHRSDRRRHRMRPAGCCFPGRRACPGWRQEPKSR